MSNKQSEDPSELTEPRRFPVVGIGASAGGLDALRRLLQAMPDEPNVAIVIVQHLARDKPSLAPELLAKYTSMEVRQVHDEPLIRRNCVYIIPPGKYLGIVDRRLRLSPIEGPRCAPIAIDYFFRALAKDQRECAVGIILSGTGSDGTLGIKAIKEAGGFVIAQETSTAEHRGMPTSAIESGMVDQVLTPEQIPEALSQFAQHPYICDTVDLAPASAPDENRADDEMQTESLDAIIGLLLERSHRDFRNYKHTTLLRRTRRRMCLQHIDRLSDYLQLLKRHTPEVTALAKDLLISVTDFFRDPEAWEKLAAEVVPEIVNSKTSQTSGDESKSAGQCVRVWIPGCATGEEAYSIAMLFLDELRKQRKICKLQIFASDIDTDALQFARVGRYPVSIEADVSRERLSRYFSMHDGQLYYQVNNALREVVVFANQNLIADPPFSQLDMICCRNVLIYLKPETQHKVIAMFHFALQPHAYLMLGTAETVGRHDHLFDTFSKRWRIFRSIGVARPASIELPITATSLRREMTTLRPPPQRETRLMLLAQKKLLDILAPRAVLIDRHWRILYISGDVSAYMTLPPGVPNDELLNKLRGGLRSRLRVAVHKALAERKRTFVNCQLESGSTKMEIQVEVRLIRDANQEDDFVLLVFHDAAERKDGLPSSAAVIEQRSLSPDADEPELNTAELDEESLIRHLEEELAATKDDLQGTLEQFEVAHEEYKASNEEVMSVNEELQSTNEELETSREELQSLIEELVTVNQQLASKVEELESKHADLENLISATEVATICLGADLTIRWFTPAAQAVVRVKVADHGRPLGDLANDFLDNTWLEACARVLKDLTPVEAEVECSAERTFILRVVPYRTVDLRVQGVVITMIDITARKLHEEVLRASEERFRRALSVDGVAVIFFKPGGDLIDCNDWFLKATGYSRSEVESLSLTSLPLTPPEWIDETLRQFAILQETGRLGPFDCEYFCKDGSRTWLMLSGCSQEDGTVVAHGIDINKRKQVELQLQELNGTLEVQVMQRTELLSILQYVTRVANESRNVEEAMIATLKRISTYNGWLAGHVWTRVDDRSSEVKSVGIWYVREEDATANAQYAKLREKLAQTEEAPNQGLVELVIATGKPQWAENIEEQGVVSDYSTAGLHAAIAFPILVAGEVVAVMEFWSDEATVPQQGLLEIITEVGIQLGHMIGRDRSDRIAAEIALAEQRRIGRELHDGIAQQLTGGSLIAETLKRSLPPELSAQRENTDHLREILRQTHRDVRQLISGLIPCELPASDFLPALRQLAAETTARYGIPCSIREELWRDDFIRNDSVAFLAFQIAREAIHNTVKHADATHIEVELAMSDEFRMTIRDDGKGMKLAQAHKPNSNGLRIMGFRAEAAGGTLEIASLESVGLQVQLAIPQTRCQS